MLVSTRDILQAVDGYAIAGFNVYNLEGVQAVIEGAEQLDSCVVLQVHAEAVKVTGLPLIDLCMSYARFADVPVSVHLDHASDPSLIRAGIDAGISSVMADGSHLPYEENVAFVHEMTSLAHREGVMVEAGLGRMSGTQDGLTVADAEHEARLTDPGQAARFIVQTNADMLAVCIGNAPGQHLVPPALDFNHLGKIRDLVNVPLVLHGASGLDGVWISQAIVLGIRKINVNSEVRQAYIKSLKSLSNEGDIDLPLVMKRAGDAMREAAIQKIQLFGSVDSAKGW